MREVSEWTVGPTLPERHQSHRLEQTGNSIDAVTLAHMAYISRREVYPSLAPGNESQMPSLRNRGKVQDQVPARTKRACQICERQMIIFDVFQDVGAGDEVVLLARVQSQQVLAAKIDVVQSEKLGSLSASSHRFIFDINAGDIPSWVKA